MELAEVTHQCPPEGGVMPCCGLTPFEAPRTDRMTEDPALVTCGTGPAKPKETDAMWRARRLRGE